MYARWEGWEEYSSPEHMRPYSNCLYRMPVDPQNNIDALYSFPEYEELYNLAFSNPRTLSLARRYVLANRLSWLLIATDTFNVLPTRIAGSYQ